MSRILEMIENEEVEWSKIKEVFYIRNGYTPSKNNKEFWENGTIPWYRMEDIREQGKILGDSRQYITKKAVKGSGLFKKDSIILATTATIGEHAILTIDSLSNQQFTNFEIREIFKNRLIPKYVFYYFDIIDEWCKKNIKSSSFPTVNMDNLKELDFPIPSLETQEKIVKILDEFTGYITTLQTELDKRTKQYEYYRDLLLSEDYLNKKSQELCGEGSVVEWSKIKEVFYMRNGYTPSKKNKVFWDSGTIPWYRMEDIREQGRILGDSIQHITENAVKGSGLFKKDSVILATSATIGEHAILTCDALSNQRFTNFEICEKLKKRLLPKYVFYYFDIIDEWCMKNEIKTSFPTVNIDNLKELDFPIPPLEVREHIVFVLDKFDRLVNDIKEGLPREIELRQKQYEYYREKLLSFKIGVDI